MLGGGAEPIIINYKVIETAPSTNTVYLTIYNEKYQTDYGSPIIINKELYNKIINDIFSGKTIIFTYEGLNASIPLVRGETVYNSDNNIVNVVGFYTIDYNLNLQILLGIADNPINQ